MRIAVLTLTRDRAAFTRHCFASLHENAGVHFHHYVLDQASDDDTPDVLADFPCEVIFGDENIGISRGMNLLLDTAGPGYDVYVKYDNDCELLDPDTLKVACELVTYNPTLIVSPRIQGLQNPPAVLGETYVNGTRIGLTGIIGGIFMAVPAPVFDVFRYDDTNPKWGHDDIQLSNWRRGTGGHVGYMLDYPANHYLTTDGQQADEPVYFTRKFEEMGIA